MKMMTNRAYQGVWGVSVEFNIQVVHFAADGNGVLKGFMCALPFTWTADREGHIQCRIDPDMAMIWGAWFDTLSCSYNPVLNEMVMDNLGDMRRDWKNVGLKTLPYLGEGEGVEGLRDRFAEFKCQNEDFESELESAKAKWSNPQAVKEIAMRREQFKKGRKETIETGTKKFIEILKARQLEEEPEEMSLEEYERAFYGLDDAEAKSLLVQDARKRYPEFHPEWRSKSWIGRIWPW